MLTRLNSCLLRLQDLLVEQSRFGSSLEQTACFSTIRHWHEFAPRELPRTWDRSSLLPISKLLPGGLHAEQLTGGNFPLSEVCRTKAVTFC